MTDLRDYDRDAYLMQKVRYLEEQLADARELLNIAQAEIERLQTLNAALCAKANGYVISSARAAEEIERLRGVLDKVGLSLNITRANIECVLWPDSGMAKGTPKPGEEIPKTRSQQMREAGFTRRPPLPSDE